MEFLGKVFRIAKQNWPLLALGLLAFCFYVSHSNSHDYMSMLRQLQPSHKESEGTEVQKEGMSFGGSVRAGGAVGKKEAKGFSGADTAAASASDMAESENAETSSPLSAANLISSANADDASGMLIRNGSIHAYVDSIVTAKKTAEEKIKANGGRIDNENQRNEYSGIILSMTIKVPAAKFQALYDDLLKISDKVSQNSIDVDDVMKAYIDVKSRLGNKIILQARLRELAKRAGKVGDVLEVERELSRVSEDIDSTTKQMKQYEHDVAFSSIYVDFTEPKANTSIGPVPISFFKKIGVAFKAGFDWVLDTILEFISWWPMLIVLALGYLYWRRLKKRLPRKK